MTILFFAVVHHLVAVDRLVKLPDRGIDAQLTEHAFHAEGAGLVGEDRHDALAQILVLHQLRQDSTERHGGGNLAITGTVEHCFEGVQRRRRDAEALRPALRQRTTEFLAAFAQVAHLGAVFGRAVERQFFELRIVDRDVEAIAEFLQAVDIDFLGVVGDVLGLSGTGAVALDGLGQDDCRLALVVDRLVVSGIDLVRIVAAAVELPDFLI